jgi:hypothetical protein
MGHLETSRPEWPGSGAPEQSHALTRGAVVVARLTTAVQPRKNLV